MPIITRSLFEHTLEKYKPNKFIRFFYEDHKIIDNSFKCLLILCFIYMAFHFEHEGYYSEWGPLFKIAFYTFCSIFPIAILNLIAKTMNNRRIKKICKELGINLEGYNYYLSLYKLN